jgi:hypothetical protein
MRGGAGAWKGGGGQRGAMCAGSEGKGVQGPGCHFGDADLAEARGVRLTWGKCCNVVWTGERWGSEEGSS